VQEGELTWNGDEVLAVLDEALMRGLQVGGEHILTESRKVAPLDEGTLERSGTVTPDPDKLQVIISYDTPYAVRQHEELDWRHAPGRTAKYLERPLTEEGPTALQLLAAEMRRATR
jgi:hypothetical protein